MSWWTFLGDPPLYSAPGWCFPCSLPGSSYKIPKGESKPDGLCKLAISRGRSFLVDSHSLRSAYLCLLVIEPVCYAFRLRFYFAHCTQHSVLPLIRCPSA